MHDYKFDVEKIAFYLIKHRNSQGNIVYKNIDEFNSKIKAIDQKASPSFIIQYLINMSYIKVIRTHPFYEIQIDTSLIKNYSSSKDSIIIPQKAKKSLHSFYSSNDLEKLYQKLRPYQLDIIQNISSTGDDVIIELPTGSGKTFIALHIIIDELQKNGKVLFLAPKLILIEQVLEEFKHLNPYRVYGSHFDTSHSLLVSTLHTMANRKIPSDLSLLIIDEAHYGHNQQMQKVIKQNVSCRKIALSATPYDFEGNLIDGYQRHINKYNMQYMLENKYLVPYNFFKILNVDLSDITIMRGDYNLYELYEMYKGIESCSAIVENTLIHISNRKKIIVFAINILHSVALAEEFKNFGIKSKAIHSKLSKDEQNHILKDFKDGDLKILVSVEQLTTGFDAPIADTIIFARPTKSYNLYQQMVGRVLRPFINKDDALLLDCAGLIDSLGLPDRRGIPVDVTKYDLTHLALNKYRIKPKKKNNFLYENYLRDMERLGVSKPYMTFDEFEDSIDKKTIQPDSVKQSAEVISSHVDVINQENIDSLSNEVTVDRNINHKTHYFGSKSEIDIPKIIVELDIPSAAATEYKKSDSLLDMSSINGHQTINDFIVDEQDILSNNGKESSSHNCREIPNYKVDSTTLLSKIEQHSKTIQKIDVELNPNIINPYEYIKTYIQQVKNNKLNRNDCEVKIVKSFFIEKESQLVRVKIKDFLYQNYKGHCQICGFTFTKIKDSKNYFEVFNWQDYRIVSSKKYLSTADSLCLCSNCVNNIKWGSFGAIFVDKLKFYQINDIELLVNIFHVSDNYESPKIFQELIEFNDMYALDIVINNNLGYIYFTHEHLFQFLAYLQLESDFSESQ